MPEVVKMRDILIEVKAFICRSRRLWKEKTFLLKVLHFDIP